MAQNRVQVLAVVDAAMNNRVPQEAENMFPS
jgi:hypothetical protein